MRASSLRALALAAVSILVLGGCRNGSNNARDTTGMTPGAAAGQLGGASTGAATGATTGVLPGRGSAACCDTGAMVQRGMPGMSDSTRARMRGTMRGTMRSRMRDSGRRP